MPIPSQQHMNDLGERRKPEKSTLLGTKVAVSPYMERTGPRKQHGHPTYGVFSNKQLSSIKILELERN